MATSATWMGDVAENRGGFSLGGNLHGFVSSRVQRVENWTFLFIYINLHSGEKGGIHLWVYDLGETNFFYVNILDNFTSFSCNNVILKIGIRPPLVVAASKDDITGRDSSSSA